MERKDYGWQGRMPDECFAENMKFLEEKGVNVQIAKNKEGLKEDMNFIAIQNSLKKPILNVY